MPVPDEEELLEFSELLPSEGELADPELAVSEPVVEEVVPSSGELESVEPLSLAEGSVLDESELAEPLDDSVLPDDMPLVDPEVGAAICPDDEDVRVAIPPTSAAVVMGPPE